MSQDRNANVVERNEEMITADSLTDGLPDRQEDQSVLTG